MTESSRQTSRVGSILATDLARPKAASSFALKWSAQIGGADGWTDGRISIRIRVALWRLAQLCAVSGPYITTDSLELSLMSLSALICIEIRGNESEVFFSAHYEKLRNNSGQSVFLNFCFLQSNRFKSHKLDTTYSKIIIGSRSEQRHCIW